MPSAWALAQLLLHPAELRAVIQWKLMRTPLHPRQPKLESRELQRCYELLRITSRSFAAVVEELNPKLRNAIMIFYVILRALDTVEDDMTLSNNKKVPILREFYKYLDQPGWTFNESGPNEKDRIVLVEFDKIISQFKELPLAYRVIIQDITRKMGSGMADYCLNKEFQDVGVLTIKDYDLYCYYVAGIVGEGCTRLFVEVQFADPKLLTKENIHLYLSMGLFLQKTNITRDFREDLDDGRIFYPKEIWAKYASNVKDLINPENKQNALYCLDEMIANALEHIPDVLRFLAAIKDQSTFNFCAIPQVMAIATLGLIFKNYRVFETNVKLRRGRTAELILKTTNVRSVCDIFLYYIREIHKQNTPDDPSYLRIEVACGQVEQFVTVLFPPMPKSIAEKLEEKRSNFSGSPFNDSAKGNFKDTLLIGLAMISIIGSTFLIMGGVAWLFGARFDLVFETFRKSSEPSSIPISDTSSSIAATISSVASSISQSVKDEL